MAFFKKLKDRLFKSSSKIDEGLEAIVEDGGEEIAGDVTGAPGAHAAAPEPARPPAPPEVPEPQRETPEPPREVPEAPREVPEAPREVPEAPREEPERPVEDPDAPETEPGAPDEVPAPPAEPEAPPETPEIPPAPPPSERPAPDLPEPEPVPVEIPSSEPRFTGNPGVSAAATVDLAPAIDPVPLREAGSPAPKAGLLSRLFRRDAGKPVLRRTLDDDMLEQLEELLISADMGVDTALRVTANMAEGRMGRKLSVEEIKELLAQEIARIMEPVARPLPLYPKRPQVVLVVGVNGSGKTTTIGKLASQFRAAGKKVVIAAGDTFRAAAVEQLQIWGERAGVPVLTAPEGSDPASLAFDALTKAQQEGADLLMIDTAGRLQNRKDLMEELAKIVRVLRKKDETAPHNTLLVLDATTGQNALSQVKIFQEVADVSGLVMTKLDGTAKGGVLVALADKFGLPIHAIGVGEQIDDLAPFDPEEFAAALTGLEAA